MTEQPIRVLLAKVGLDGHDRGLRVIARILRDGGCEVIYGGLRQTPAMIAAAVLQEDVDVVGLSMHNGAHLTLAPDVIAALGAVGLDTPVIVGGIIPDHDLKAMSVERRRARRRHACGRRPGPGGRPMTLRGRAATRVIHFGQ